MRQYTSDRRVIARCPSGSGWGLLIVLIAMFLAVPARGQTVIYVDTDAVGANDGTSWADAFVYLQDALAVAQAGDEVWVAEGVYRPDQGAGITALDRSAVFEMEPGAALIGGFLGTESSLQERREGQYETVLSGDLLSNDPLDVTPDPDSVYYDDNSKTIVLAGESAQPTQSVIDGLTIRGANGGLWPDPGSALRVRSSHCVLSHLRIVENIGAEGAGANLVGSCIIDDVHFARNNSPYSILTGGALYVRGPSWISRSSFTDNRADLGGGGAIRVAGYDTVFVSKSVFVSNGAWDGGAISMASASVAYFVSSRFISNVASCSGGAIQVDEESNAIVVNTLLASNQAIGECDELKGGGAVFVYRGKFSALNSTFVANGAGAVGDVLAAYEGMIDFENSLVAVNDGSGAAADIFAVESAISLGFVLHDEPIPDDAIRTGPLFEAVPSFLDPDGIDGQIGTVDDNYGLMVSSPGVDLGRNALLPPDVADIDSDNDRSEPLPIDIVGNPRILAVKELTPTVDIGAYEATGSTSADTPPATPHSRRKCPSILYPNPFRNVVTVTFPGSQVQRIEVYDMLGRRRFDSSDNDAVSRVSAVSLDASTWSPGVYLFRVSTNWSLCSAIAAHIGAER